jgi:aerobic carbon-monoxide dehydrogenase small subunit
MVAPWAGRLSVEIDVDGHHYELPDAVAGQSLLRVLRDVLGITAAKNACEQGECGSCTVSVDGEIVCACLLLAAQADGSVIETAATAPENLRAAFIRHGAIQCGFCTPGMVVAASDLLRRVPSPSEDDVREGLSGNLCRCTGYQKIVAAVRDAGDGR